MKVKVIQSWPTLWDPMDYSPADLPNPGIEPGSPAFAGRFFISKTSLNIWKFTVHILLKPGLENSEHYLLAC